MKTLVFQSFRRNDVPGWMTQCLNTVRQWACAKGFEYTFIGDELFQCVPENFRQRVDNYKVPMSDFARIDWARRLLVDYERVIWVDADVVVCDAASFDIVVNSEFAFCKEVWIDRNRQGHIVASNRVNNAVSVYVRGNGFLDYYHYACLQMIRNTAVPMHRITLGTAFLTQHHAWLNFTLLNNVAMVSPLMLHDLAQGHTGALGAVYRARLSAPIAAANLCASFYGQSVGGMQMNDEVYTAALGNLIATRGSIINQYIGQVAN